MLVCSDLARSRDFYRQVMGLRCSTTARRIGSSSRSRATASRSAASRSDLLAVRPGSLQLGFSVENVEKFIADCAALNVPVLQYPYEDGNLRLAVISDPDGYPIQVTSGKR